MLVFRGKALLVCILAICEAVSVLKVWCQTADLRAIANRSHSDVVRTLLDWLGSRSLADHVCSMEDGGTKEDQTVGFCNEGVGKADLMSITLILSLID